MKYQRGLTLTGLIMWGIILALVAVLGMKVVPTAIEYGKLLKDIKSTVNRVGNDASVAEVKKTFSDFANIDQLDITAEELNITKEGGKIVISFDYEKKIPLFYNVYLLINYKGTTAPHG